jgi:hypothetical protein
MLRRVLLAAVLIGAFGCRKKDAPQLKEESAPKESAGVPSNPQQAQQDALMEAQFLPSAKTRPSKSIEDRLDGAVHAKLTAQLHMFKVLKGRMPENFYEFANTVGDSVPRLPEGMKFAIDPTDETVKAVKK